MDPNQFKKELTDAIESAAREFLGTTRGAAVAGAGAEVRRPARFVVEVVARTPSGHSQHYFVSTTLR